MRFNINWILWYGDCNNLLLVQMMYSNEVNYADEKVYIKIYGEKFVKKLHKDLNWLDKNILSKTKCMSDVPLLWADIVREFCERNKEAKILQIKEKFGGLRLYLDTVESLDYITYRYEGRCEERTRLTKLLMEKK